MKVLLFILVDVDEKIFLLMHWPPKRGGFSPPSSPASLNADSRSCIGTHSFGCCTAGRCVRTQWIACSTPVLMPAPESSRCGSTAHRTPRQYLGWPLAGIVRKLHRSAACPPPAWGGP